MKMKRKTLEYVASVGIVATAAGIRVALLSTLGTRAPFLTFYPAVALAALYGGMAGGLVATGGSALLASFFWMEPVGRLGIEDPRDWLALGIFIGSGILISFVSEQRHRFRNRTTAAEAETRLAAIVEFSDDAIVGKDLNGIITSWNRGAEKIFGYSAAEMVGASIMRLIPADRQADEDIILGAIRRGESVEHFETIRQTKDGRLIQVSVTASPIKDFSGKVIGVSKVARDITERKNSEKLLREREEQLRLYAEHSPASVAMFDQEMKYLVASRRWLQDYRLGVESIVGRSHYEVFPEVSEHWREIHRRCLAGEHAKCEEEAFVRGDGATDWIRWEIRPWRQADGGIGGIIIFSEDITARKLAEAARQESDSRYRTLFENAPDGILIADPQSIYLDANPSICRMLDYAREELVGKNAADIIAPAEVPLIGDALDIIKTKSDYHQEWQFRRKDGSIFPADVIVKVMPNGNLLGVIRDITERRAMEQARRASEQLLQSVMDLVPHFIFAKDSQSRHLLVNRACAAANGLSPEQMLGQNDREIVKDPAQAERFMQDDREVIAGGKPKFVPEEVLTTATGERRIYQTTKIPFSLPGIEGPALVGVAVDITDIKRAEAALQESENRFRSLANSMSQLAWIARADGYIFWYNERWYEYTGTTPAQMEGWGWQSVHDPAQLPRVMERWQHSIDSQLPFEMEFPLKGADGQFRDFLTRGEPVKDPTGKVLQWVGTNTDIDLIKQAEEKIRLINVELEERVAQRTAQLESANKELEAFSYSVSHDLRAPLRSINGFSEIVLKEYAEQLPEEGKRYLGIIREGGLEMGELIDDLLAFSRLSRQSLSKRPVDMAQLIQDCLKELGDERDGREVEVRVGELPPALADRSLLKQACFNLLSNAFKYTRQRKPAIIEIGFLVKEGEGVYFIRDNGAGFDMQYAGKLFGVFQRLHRAEEFEGTGVGLAIVQRVIQRHGGRVWAEAVVDQGATFYFTLEPV